MGPEKHLVAHMKMAMPLISVWWRIAFKTQIMKTLEILLAATTLAKEQCHKSLSPALNATLSSSGIAESVANVVCYSPSSSQGLNVSHLCTTQGIHHISKLPCALGLPHLPSFTLLQSTIETAQIKSGLLNSSWDASYVDFEVCCTPSWITHAQKFLLKTKATLLHSAHPVKMDRTENKPITSMISALTSGPIECQRLNWCHLHLGAVCMGSPFDALGTQLQWGVLDLSKSFLDIPPGWPLRPCPSQPTFHQWQLFLTSLGVHLQPHTLETIRVGYLSQNIWKWWRLEMEL